MGDRPTLHLTNWSSRKLHGPGRKLTIMAAPRRWEHGDGRVPAIVPPLDWLREALGGTLALEEYRRRYEDRLSGLSFLAPGALRADTPPGWVDVRDGDTLCCACSRADAAAGRCHRAWAAPFLVRAGWRVILDGVEVTLD